MNRGATTFGRLSDASLLTCVIVFGAVGLIVPLLGFIVEQTVGYGRDPYDFLWDWYAKLHVFWPVGRIMIAGDHATGRTPSGLMLWLYATAANVVVYQVFGAAAWVVMRAARATLLRRAADLSPDRRPVRRGSHKVLRGAIAALPGVIVLGYTAFLLLRAS